MENSNQSQQKDTDISSIYLKIFKKLVSLMDESPFMAALALFVNLNKAHFLQYFIE